MNFHPVPAPVRKSRRGFTLIELLTVIAIIGILAAIIIPVVGKVRTTAKRSQGLSNLRQITMAGLTFASENRGHWFFGEDRRYDGDTQSRFWADTLTAYMSSKSASGTQDYSEVFRDPLVNAAPDSGRRIHYASLLAFGGYGGNVWCTLTRYNKLENVRSPAKQVFMADIYVGSEGTGAWGMIQNAGKNNSMWGWPGQWGGFSPNEADAAFTPPETYGLAGGEVDFSRDPGRAKIGYLDGHVATVTREQLTHRSLDPRYN